MNWKLILPWVIAALLLAASLYFWRQSTREGRIADLEVTIANTEYLKLIREISAAGLFYRTDELHVPGAAAGFKIQPDEDLWLLNPLGDSAWAFQDNARGSYASIAFIGHSTDGDEEGIVEDARELAQSIFGEIDREIEENTDDAWSYRFIGTVPSTHDPIQIEILRIRDGYHFRIRQVYHGESSTSEDLESFADRLVLY